MFAKKIVPKNAVKDKIPCESGELVPALQKDKIRKKLAILNSIELKEEIDKLRRKILNRQSEIHKQKSRAALVAADSVPSVPSGTLSTSSATTNVFSSPSQLFSANPFGVILNEE